MSDSTNYSRGILQSYCTVCGGIGSHYSFCENQPPSDSEKTDPEIRLYDQEKMVELLEKLTYCIEVEKEMLIRVENLLVRIIEQLKV